MGMIDIKDCILRIQDGGTVVAGAVNKPATAAQTDFIEAGTLNTGMVTVIAGGLTAAHYRGEKFLIQGDSTVYTLTSDVAASDLILYFTPSLNVAVTSVQDITFQTGYGLGASHIVVDGFSAGATAAGSIINFVGSNVDYIISIDGAAAGSGYVSIMPELQTSIADDVVINGHSAPNYIEVDIGEGDVSFTEHMTREYKKNRGKLDTVRNADEEPLDVTFDFQWKWLRSNSTDTAPGVIEALKGLGIAGDWVSSSNDPCEPYAVDIVILNVPPCGSAGSNETIIFPDFRWEQVNGKLKDGSVSVSGKCNATGAILARDV